MTADLAAKEAQLAALRDQHANLDPNPGTSAMRGKQHGIRVDAALRRSAQLSQAIQRLEREVEVLRRSGGPPAQTPGVVSAEAPAGARFVRTRYGWHEVVKVNRASVKVLAAPGMNDLIPHGRILEARAAIKPQEPR